MGDGSVAELVKDALDGTEGAWDEIVERFSGLVCAVARNHGLGDADVADVAQTAWLRLAEHLASIREPEKLGAWLVTTARFESMRVRRAYNRCAPSPLPAANPAEVDDRILDLEARAALERAVAELPRNCRQLLGALMADPPLSYAEVSRVLDMPIGSIGPRRARCLACLRGMLWKDESVMPRN